MSATRVFLLAAISACAICATPSAADYYTVVGENSAPALETGVAIAECGGGVPVGGGFDSLGEASLRTLASIAIAPADYQSWRAVVRNAAAEPVDVSTAVICADHLRRTNVVVDSFPAFGSFVLEEVALCPFGRWAHHGGSTSSGPDASVFAVADSPYFFETGTRLRDLDDGDGPAPTGWLVARSSDSAAVAIHSAAAQVLCGAAIPTTKVVSGVAQGGSIGVAIAVCPADEVALGGGADADELGDLQLVSSGPLFAPTGGLFPRRLASLSPGEEEAPIGWRVALRNTSGAPRPFKMAAVCVPEPGSAALAVAALAAIAARHALPRRR